MDSKDYAQAQEYFSRLQRKGADTAMLREMLQQYPPEEAVRIPTQANVRYRSSYDHKAIETIRKLVRWDQDVRAYYSGLTNGDYMVDSVFKADDEIARRLLGLFRKYGLPDEGVFWDTHCDIIIKHNTGSQLSGNSTHIFDTLLFNAVRTLDYDARLFASYIEQNSTSDSFTSKGVTLHFPLTIYCASYNNIWYPEYYNDSSEQRIDAERAKLGLESLADFRAKVAVRNRESGQHSPLGKYSLLAGNKLLEAEADQEEKFKEWMLANGQDARIRKSLPARKEQNEFIAMGKVGIAVLGKTNFDELMAWYRTFNTEYYEPETPYMSFSERAKKLNWNYHTEFVPNSRDEPCSDTGLSNAALFVDGYRIIGTGGESLKLFDVDDIEMLFQDQVLIHYTAQIKPATYPAFLQYLGPASSVGVTLKRERLRSEVVLLKTKEYLWVRTDLQAKLSLSEFLDASGKKRTRVWYTMYKTAAYTAYQQKVARKRALLQSRCSERRASGPR